MGRRAIKKKWGKAKAERQNAEAIGLQSASLVNIAAKPTKKIPNSKMISGPFFERNRDIILVSALYRVNAVIIASISEAADAFL